VVLMVLVVIKKLSGGPFPEGSRQVQTPYHTQYTTHSTLTACILVSRSCGACTLDGLS